jgi:hypothetical protein
MTYAVCLRKGFLGSFLDVNDDECYFFLLGTLGTLGKVGIVHAYLHEAVRANTVRRQCKYGNEKKNEK